MENSLIVVEQLPVIKEQLQAVKAGIQQRVDNALSLVCTEDNYKDIKKVRAELNNEFKTLEARRKEVKATIMAPYNAFEAVYKDCAGDMYTKADRELKVKIDEVEDGLRKEKDAALNAFFEAKKAELQIQQEWVNLPASGITATLSASKKAMETRVTEYLEATKADLEAIAQSPDRDELEVEYSRCGDLAKALVAVNNRKMAIEAQKKARAEQEMREQARQIAELQKAQPEPTFIPEDIPDDDIPSPAIQTKTVTMQITGTPEQIEYLKLHMLREKIVYMIIK